MSISVTTHVEQGDRPYQEDRHLVVEVDDGITLGVVCDGHGDDSSGDMCADVSIKNFVTVFKKVYDEKRSSNIRPSISCLLHKAVKHTVMSWDRLSLGVRTMNKIAKASGDDRAAIRDRAFARMTRKKYAAYFENGMDSGCTLSACVVDVPHRKVFTANLGDSRTIICTGNAMISTVDHAVNSELARKRGVPVENGRVAGELAMMGAIGDNTPTLAGLVSRKTDVRTYALEKNMQIVIASDGFFDNYSDQSACMHLLKSDATAFSLVQSGRPPSGTYHDNTSVILIKASCESEADDDKGVYATFQDINDSLQALNIAK